MSAALRIAVVGVGHLGQHHARLLASMDGVQLVGIVDTKPGRAGEIASKLGVPSFTHLGELPLDGLDAVTIAVPTVSHLDVALPLIDAGVSVLVEKPLSSSLGDADKMIESAARRGVVLAAGHTERFNPAVVAALPLVSNPRFIEVHRLGTFPERSLDIDVIFDLMIHDLDLLLTSVKSEVVSIEAIGVNVLTPKTDIANVRLRFESGCIANVTASRISRDKIRKVRFFQPASYLSIDYAAQEAEIYRLVAHNGRPQIEGGKLDIKRDEPLRAELADFVGAVRDRREPGVSGRAGRDALALATKVAETMEASAG
ncbi:MAG TPA: Gfo/Idh/MocA family oxidoreductase [Vicinamibacterales bacterium]|jgi:predicted dehydrogenase|nr:Gfo/Idh/MocA family oxidoreductase [Vicinamibacterales bacterium]